MTKTEKSMILGLVVCLFLLFGSVYILSKSIDDAGGVKSIAVSIGKEVKDIKRQIIED